jgi:3-oxoacyl-[acyl-carrier protein] reductase
MDLELDGRTAVVIGGSSGIGAAVAEVLAEEGCDVAVTYRRSRDGAEQAAAEVRPAGAGAAGAARRGW